MLIVTWPQHKLFIYNLSKKNFFRNKSNKIIHQGSFSLIKSDICIYKFTNKNVFKINVFTVFQTKMFIEH